MLLPCPFCGVSDAHVACTGASWVVCDGCEAEGPAECEEQEAIDKWNTRATPTATGDDYKTDRLLESQYRAGMRAGWNFGLTEDREGFSKAMEAHSWRTEEATQLYARTATGGDTALCSDCPAVGYETDRTRCLSCPRRTATGGDALAATAPSPMNFFAENVDAWGAAEWFNRLATAVRQQDSAVRAGDEMAMETCRNVAASSAMRLVRDYEPQVRAALSGAQPVAARASDLSVDPIAFINRRLEDLAEANAIYGKDQRLNAPDNIARNDREISWLKDLRSMVAMRHPAQAGHASPLSKRLYALSEPHLSGYRLVLGFETLADCQAAHEAIAVPSTEGETRG